MTGPEPTPDAALEAIPGAVPPGPPAPGVDPAPVPIASVHCERGRQWSGPLPAGLADHPRYRIIDIVETGGMGTVFKAEHSLMKRQVALKIINPHLVRNPQMHGLFLREVQAVARLVHPNIVAAFDADRVGDLHFLVMELVEGLTLHQVVSDKGPLPIALACEYARQAASGLQHAHERGIMHRDIKPHNLMLAAGGRIKILDFGLARYLNDIDPVEFELEGGEEIRGMDFPQALDDRKCPTEPMPESRKTLPVSRRATYRGMGTPDFIAPELAIDPRRADIRSDIYSLGCTLYYLLTGQVLFPGGALVDKLKSHISRTPVPMAQLRPVIPARLASVVEQMIAKSPGRRYQTPAQVALALAPFALPLGGHVLVVEDDSASREALVVALECQGFRVTAVATGREALVQARSGSPPALILLNLLTSQTDGWDFLKAQRDDPGLARLPVVVVSAADPAVLRAVALGAADFLRRPVDPG